MITLLAERAPPAQLPLARSYLPQHVITQERGIGLALVRKSDNLLCEELFFAFGFVGQIENLAHVVERR